MVRNLFLSIAWFLLLINLGVPLQGGYNRHPFFLDMNVLRTTWYIRVSAFTFNFSSRTLTISKVRTPVSNKSTSCPGFEIQEERYPMGSFRMYSMFFGLRRKRVLAWGEIWTSLHAKAWILITEKPTIFCWQMLWPRTSVRRGDLRWPTTYN